jgi:TM2 domain-containing membrane protein YozV
MKCPFCNAEIEDNLVFCPSCGAKLFGNEEKSPEQPQDNAQAQCENAQAQNNGQTQNNNGQPQYNGQAQCNGQPQYNNGQAQYNGQPQYNGQAQYNGQPQYNNGQAQYNGQPQYNGGYVQQLPVKSKMAAGILAILLGDIGVHKFYLGNIGMGILYLCFCWTGIPGVIGLIEGIIYLTSSKEDFERKNNVRCSD